MTAQKEPGESILIVEDDKGTQSLLQRLLSHWGYTVMIASDGQEGLQKALTERPDLILMDLNMPRMSGLEVLYNLREHQSDIPVILMTVFGSEEIVVQALRLGVRDYLSKPFSPDRLQEAAERALAAGRLQRQKELLARQEAALKMMEQVIVTVAHHVSNPLMALSLALDSLKGHLRTRYQLDTDPAIQENMRLIESKTNEIAIVVDILRRLDAISTIPYVGQIEMLDIADELKRRLHDMNP